MAFTYHQITNALLVAGFSDNDILRIMDALDAEKLKEATQILECLRLTKEIV